MPKTKKALKLYACCMNQRCVKYQDILSFLQTWGLEPLPGKDKDGHFFDVSPPHYWQENRRNRFAAALEQRPPAKHR